jgi:hypothetical protein
MLYFILLLTNAFIEICVKHLINISFEAVFVAFLSPSEQMLRCLDQITACSLQIFRDVIIHAI